MSGFRSANNHASSLSFSMFGLLPVLDNNWPAAKRDILVGSNSITLMEIKITTTKSEERSGKAIITRREAVIVKERRCE